MSKKYPQGSGGLIKEQICAKLTTIERVHIRIESLEVS